MIPNIHFDAVYLLEARSRSQVAGHFMLASKPTNSKPLRMNGAIDVFCGILKFVLISAAEVELGTLFPNVKEGNNLCIALQELGHKQPPTPMHCGNVTTTGTTNDITKQ